MLLSDGPRIELLLLTQESLRLVRVHLTLQRAQKQKSQSTTYANRSLDFFFNSKLFMTTNIVAHICGYIFLAYVRRVSTEREKCKDAAQIQG